MRDWVQQTDRCAPLKEREVAQRGEKKMVERNLRNTQIRSDSKDIYVPNALLTESVLTEFNSDGFLLQDFIGGLEYGSDYEKAVDAVKKVLDENQNVISKDLHNSTVAAGIAGATIQLTVRYWAKADAVVSDGRTRSKLLSVS